MRRKNYEKNVKPKNGARFRVGIVVSHFNADITDSMLAGALETLREWNVRASRTHVIQVPGSFEIPYGCLTLLSHKQKPHAIITIGCIIKGETKHDEYLASAVSHGLMRLSLEHKTPISFGIITTNNLKQARARSTGPMNKGREAAHAALEMALLK